MKYNVKRFEDIYRLSDFLNDNNIKPADIVGIYREHKYQDQGYFDLLYIESDNEKKMETYEFRYSDFFEWLKSRDGKQGERRKMTREKAIEIIKDYKVEGCGYCHQGGDEVEEAFQMAIKALEQYEDNPTMTNAELFEKTFGRFATEIWALPEKYFLEWLKTIIEADGRNKEC